MYKSTLGQSCPIQHCVIHNKTSLYTRFKDNFSRALVRKSLIITDIFISTVNYDLGPKIHACDVDSGRLCHFFQTTGLIHMTMHTVHKYQKQYNLFYM